MEKIRYGMIGGGPGAFIGDAHRRAARICNDYQLLGGCFSSDYSKTEAFAKDEGLDIKRCYRTVEELIEGEKQLPESDRMQLVVIVTPNALHYDAAKRLLENGFHVICEKPMTMTVEEALDLESIVKSQNLTFALAHTYTGYPMVRQMKEIIKSGQLGVIYRVDAQYYQGWVNTIFDGGSSGISGVWRLQPEHAGVSSCIGDIGVHAFNLIEYTCGMRVEKVLADLNNAKEGVQIDLDASVLLRMENGAKGIVRSSQVAAGEENNLTIAVYGSEASLKWSQEDPNFLYQISDSDTTKIYKPAHGYNSPFAEASHVLPCGHPEGIYEALANIYKGTAKSVRDEACFEGEFPTVTDGVRGMKFIHNVVKSDEEGNLWKEM